MLIFVAQQKFGGYEDYRGGGHFSGRLTACLVAAGVVAKQLVGSVAITATLQEVGGEAPLKKELKKQWLAKIVWVELLSV